MRLHIKNTSLRNGHERLNSLRSRRLELVSTRENGRARGVRELSLPSRFSFSHTRFFLRPLLPGQAPATQANV